MNVLLIGAAAFSLWYFSQQKKKLVKSVSVDTIKVHKIYFEKKKSESAAFTTLFFTVELRVQNKSDITANLNSVDLKAAYNGQTIAKVSSNTNIELPGNTTKAVKVLMRVPTVTAVIGVFNAVKALLSGQQMSLNVTGSVGVLGGTVDVNETLPVTIA